MAAPSQFVYLQDVMKQRNAALVGLGFRELEQRADLEPLGVPRVTPLEVDGWLKMQAPSKCQQRWKNTWERRGPYVVEEIADI